MGGPVLVGLARHRGDVQTRLHLDGERHVLAGEPAGPPLDGPQLPGEEAFATGVQAAIGKLGREPAGPLHQLRSRRHGFCGDGPAHHPVRRHDLDELRNQPSEPQREGHELPPGPVRLAHCHTLRPDRGDSPRSRSVRSGKVPPPRGEKRSR